MSTPLANANTSDAGGGSPINSTIVPDVASVIPIATSVIPVATSVLGEPAVSQSKLTQKDVFYNVLSRGQQTTSLTSLTCVATRPVYVSVYTSIMVYPHHKNEL